MLYRDAKHYRQTKHVIFPSCSIGDLNVVCVFIHDDKHPFNRMKISQTLFFSNICRGGAKMLGILPVPGRPTNLDYSRARAGCACRRCEWGLFGHFFSHLSILFSFSLLLRDGPI